MTEAEKTSGAQKPPKDAKEEGRKKKRDDGKNHRRPKFRGKKHLTKRKVPKQKKEKKEKKDKPEKPPMDEETRRKRQSDKAKYLLFRKREKEKRMNKNNDILLDKIERAVKYDENKKKKKKAVLKIMKGDKWKKERPKPKPKRRGSARKTLLKPRRYVQIGTVVNILHGSSRNTLAVIVDILDNHWVMIDGMCFHQLKLGKPSPRRMMNIKDLQVTPFKIKKMSYRMAAKKIAKLAKKQCIMKKWKSTKQYATIQKRRAKRWSTDLERWRVQYNRKQRSALVKAEFLKLKKKVLDLAAAATCGKGVFTRHLKRKGLLNPEREYLKTMRMTAFKPRTPKLHKIEFEKLVEHPLELIPKKAAKSKKKPAEKAKAKPAAEKKGTEPAKAKGKEKAKPAAAKPAASKPAAKAASSKPAAKKAAKPAAK